MGQCCCCEDCCCEDCCCEDCCCEDCCCEESHTQWGFAMARPYPTYQNLLRDNEYDNDMECSYRSVCYRYMESLEIPKHFFNGVSKYNKCYCSRCQNKREVRAQRSYSFAEKHRLPIGWTRFALEVKSEDVQCFDDWKVAFHGTASKDIEKILNSEALALPRSCNEATSDPGCYYAISRQPAGHDDVQICVSPSLKYAEKCASPALYYDATTDTHYSCTVIFQVSIKPNSEGQTISNDEITMNSEVNDSELEWSTKRVDTVLICGLLIKATKFNFN